MLARARQLNQRTYGRCALVDLETGQGVYVPGAPDYFQFVDLEAAYDFLIALNADQHTGATMITNPTENTLP